MGVLRVLCLCVMLIPVSGASMIGQIFDFPFGHSPIVENTEVNGLFEHKVTFRTAVPNPLIREYYRGLLLDSEWEEVAFSGITQLMPKAWTEHLPSGFIEQQQVWLKGDLILHCFFVPRSQGESLFSISLKFMDTKTFPSEDSDFPDIAGSRLLLSYRHSLDHFETRFRMCETIEPRDYLMRTVRQFYKYEKNLEDNPIMAEYLQSIMPFLKIKNYFQSVQLYMDENQNWILFFCGEDTKNNKRMYGFFKKEIGARFK